ncbi:MAG TPA: NADH-quinone oxidoreductase subunit H, partial [Xylella fastidiosa subsp. pauca]
MNTWFLNVVDPLHQWFLGFGDIGVVLWTVLKILMIAIPLIVSVAFYVVWERKLIGWMHVRHGPMYVGMGLFQAFADVFKLLFKEVLYPSKAHKAIFVIAPLLTLAPSF